MSLVLSNCTNYKNKLNNVKEMIRNPKNVDLMSDKEKLELYNKYKDFLVDEEYFVKSVGSLLWDFTRANEKELFLRSELLKLLKNPQFSAGIENGRINLIGIDDLHKSYIPRISKRDLMMIISGCNFRVMQGYWVVQMSYVLKLILLQNIPVIDDEVIKLLDAKLYGSLVTKHKTWYGLIDFTYKSEVNRKKEYLLNREKQEGEILLSQAQGFIAEDKMADWQNVVEVSKGHILFRYLPLALSIISNINNEVSFEIIQNQFNVDLPEVIRNQFVDLVFYFVQCERNIYDEIFNGKPDIHFQDNLKKSRIKLFVESF